MVVVLVIAILLAIAIPTFLGARERSQDRAAQSSLRNALSAAKVIYAEDGNYWNARAGGELAQIEPRLNFLPTDLIASDGPDKISVAIDFCSDGVSIHQSVCESKGTAWTAGATPGTGTCTGQAQKNDTSEKICLNSGTYTSDYGLWAAAAWSESETCFYLRDSAEDIGIFAGTTYGSDDSQPSCRGANALRFYNAPDSEW